jgi:hypothetical protein
MVVAMKRIRFFCCRKGRHFRKISQNEGWRGCRPDSALAGPVQNILKKVKKRLVSPLKPR